MPVKISAYFAFMPVVILVGCGSPDVEKNNSLTSETQDAIVSNSGEKTAVKDNFKAPLPDAPVLVADLDPIADASADMLELPYNMIARGGGGASSRSCLSKECQLALSGYNSPNQQWYVVDTESYPIVKPLSKQRSFGYTKGTVELTDTGVKINSPGSYQVSFSATMGYFSDVDGHNPLIPIFVIKNGEFVPGETMAVLGFTQSMQRNLVYTFASSGILADLQAGDTLSMVITNGGSPTPDSITILSWGITVNKICD